jgi:hypothetical protein
VSSTKPDFESVRRWVASLPSAEECARAEIAPFLDMTVAERLAVFDSLQRDADEMLAGRMPLHDPADDDWWRRWRDPSYGRPR